MIRGAFIFIFILFRVIGYSQSMEKTQSFITKLRIDWNDSTVTDEKFFSIRIPARFVYDSVWSNAYDPIGSLSIHSETRIDSEEFLSKVMIKGKYNLLKYAHSMTKEHFSRLDTSVVSNIRTGNIQVINGCSMLRITYDLSETIWGNENKSKHVLFLVPMLPKSESPDNEFENMIFLNFSFFLTADPNAMNNLIEQIIKTIKPL
jgi:phosphotransferase system IIB component